jgi:P pilus assembly chaperone PapD
MAFLILDEVRYLKKIQVFICLCAVIMSASLCASCLQIEGAIWKETVNPGDSITKMINVSIDQKDSPTNFTIETAGLGQTLEGINKPLSAADDVSPYTAAPFLSVTPSNFSLQPGGTQTIKAEAKIPTDVGSGSRFAILSLRTLMADSSSKNKGKSRVGLSIGSNIPVVFAINGTELKKTGEISDIKIEESHSAAQQNVSVILKNTGNTQYSAKVVVKLEDDKGRSLAEGEMKSGVQAIVPPFSRLLKISLAPTESLQPGTYKVNASAELEDGTVLDSRDIQFQI